MIEPADLMRIAIDKTREGLAAGQSPFGCAIAMQGEIIAAAHNTVVLTTDITAHAEVNALREGCKNVGDILLEGAFVATTCEPCPMCMAALHWARVETVYFGASIADATESGFNELHISATDMVRLGNSPVTVHGGLLAEECRQLFEDWLRRDDRRAY